MIRLICGTTPAGHDVALEDLGITGQRSHAFLDAGAAAVVYADHRRPVLHRHVHDLADLLGMGFAERAAEDGEILAEDIDHASVDRAPAGHHAVARWPVRLHPEIGAAVRHEHVELLERALVEQQLDPLARGQLALAVLCGDPPVAAAHARRFAPVLKLLKNILHGHASRRFGANYAANAVWESEFRVKCQLVAAHLGSTATSCRCLREPALVHHRTWTIPHPGPNSGNDPRFRRPLS